MKGARRELTLPLTQPVLPPRPSLDAAAQTFLDDALDRVLRGWAEGRELPPESEW